MLIILAYFLLVMWALGVIFGLYCVVLSLQGYYPKKREHVSYKGHTMSLERRYNQSKDCNRSFFFILTTRNQCHD